VTNPLADVVLAPLPEQPISTEIKIAGGVFVKAYTIAKANTVIPQHSHAYDHISYVASGVVRVWADGQPLGEFVAPTGIVIRAGVKHLFQTMEDATVLLCIHATDPVVVDEYQIAPCAGCKCP
jgi:quercetin dioxygenase-like cupin family protein